MLDGRLLRVAILLLVLLAPIAQAATPSPNRSTADGTGDQEITDMAVDPTGQFLAAVVAVDASTNPITGGLGLPTGGTSSKPDVYLCDYGTSLAPTSGSGCRSGSHSGITPTPGAGQRVDATTVTGANGALQGTFAVAGPGARVSLWRVTQDTPVWTGTVQDGGSFSAVNVSISPNPSAGNERVAVGTSSSSLTTPGRVELRGQNGTAGAYLWHVELRNPDQENVRPSAMDWSREGNVLAIGATPKGVLLLDPSGGRPTSELGGISTPESVTAVQTSRDGRYVVATGSNGVFLFETQRSGSRITVVNNSVFNRALGESAQDVAMTLDGARFAAAAGNKVHIFARTNSFALAQSAGDPYDVGARISDLAFDDSGKLLVVIAGNKVFGFGPAKTTPIWSFDATTSAFGALDGPLRRVSVSDDGQRVLVAGRTKTMAYSSVIAVAGTLATASGATTIQPTQTVPMTLSVRNSGSLTDNYTFSVEVPVGWPSASAEGIRLDPEEVGTVRFNVTAPAGAADGVYSLKVRIRSETLDALAQRRNQPTGYVAEPSFNFTIPRTVVLKVEAPDELQIVQEGAAKTIPVVIRNEGNAEGVVNLSVTQEVTSGSSWETRFEPGEQVRIAPGQLQTVNLILTAGSDAAKGGENTITIRAREGTTVEATDRIIAAVDATFGTRLSSNKTQWEFFPGQTQTILLNVTNIGNAVADYNLTYVITPASVANDWRVTFGTNKVVGLEPGATERVVVTVKAQASDAREATLTLRTHSDKDPDRRESDPFSIALLVVERPDEDEDDDGNLLPAPGLVPVLALLAALALGRRLRGGRAQ